MNRTLRRISLILVLTAVTHSTHTLVPVYKDVYEMPSQIIRGVDGREVIVSPTFRFEKVNDTYRVVIDGQVLEPERVLEGFRIVTE